MKKIYESNQYVSFPETLILDHSTFFLVTFWIDPYYQWIKDEEEAFQAHPHERLFQLLKSG